MPHILQTPPVSTVDHTSPPSPSGASVTSPRFPPTSTFLPPHPTSAPTSSTSMTATLTPTLTPTPTPTPAHTHEDTFLGSSSSVFSHNERSLPIRRSRPKMQFEDPSATNSFSMAPSASSGDDTKSVVEADSNKTECVTPVSPGETPLPETKISGNRILDISLSASAHSRDAGTGRGSMSAGLDSDTSDSSSDSHPNDISSLSTNDDATGGNALGEGASPSLLARDLGTVRGLAVGGTVDVGERPATKKGPLARARMKGLKINLDGLAAHSTMEEVHDESTQVEHRTAIKFPTADTLCLKEMKEVLMRKSSPPSNSGSFLAPSPPLSKYSRSHSSHQLMQSPSSSSNRREYVYPPNVPQYVRKKSGEPVKPSLKPLRSSMFASSTPSVEETRKDGEREAKIPIGKLGGLRVNLDLLPPGLPSSRSEPTTPIGSSKSVHFDVHLEHVKLFLAEQKPLAVSRDGSPTEASEGPSEDYFASDRSGNTPINGPSGNNLEEQERRDAAVRKSLDILPLNMPGVPALTYLSECGGHEHVKLESLILSEDARAIRGLVLVRNLSYRKWIVARFTMDRWQTTSEVSARHLESVPDIVRTSLVSSSPSSISSFTHKCLAGGSAADKETGDKSTVVKTDPFAYDRFEFFIRLADFMGRIWDRTLHLCVRYSAEGYGEMWDNNGGRNYTVVFKRKPFSQIREFGRDEKAGAAVLRGVSAMDDDDDDDDDEDGIGARMKVAALKKTLEKVMPSNGSSLGVTGMGTPSSGARAAPAPVDQPNQSGSFHQSGPPAFVNSRSAHDVLLRLGKQHSPTQSPVLPPSPSPRRMFYISGNDVPLSPRRAHKEGSLAGRYDLGSSLKNAATGGHTPEKSPLAPANSIPFPSTGSPSRSPVSPHGMPPGSSFINQKFTSTPVTFSRVRSTSRGSPRDAALLTPGGESDQGTVKSGFWALSHSPPFRTSSDTDIPASLHSSGPSTPFESQIAHGNTGSKGKGAVGDAANKGNTQRGYFALPVRGGKKIGSKTTVSSSLTKGFHTDPTEKDAGDALVPPPTVSRFLPIPKATNTNHNMSYDVSPSISPPFSDAGWSGFDSAMDDIHRNTTSTVPFVPTSSSTALRTLSPERRDGPSRESSSDDISSASSTVPATSSDASNSTALSTPSPPSPTETSLTPKEDEIARNTNETQNLHSILDQFCFYTGPGSIGGGTRRSHSTSSVDEFFAQGGHVVPEIPLLDHSGRTTPIPYNSHYNIQRSPGAHSPNARNNARSAESTVRMQPIAG